MVLLFLLALMSLAEYGSFLGSVDIFGLFWIRIDRLADFRLKWSTVLNVSHMYRTIQRNFMVILARMLLRLFHHSASEKSNVKLKERIP